MQEQSSKVTEIIRARRSTRSYRPEPLPHEVLERVVEAGRYAPSGNNHQSTHFIVLTSPTRMAKLREVVTAALAAIPEREDTPASMLSLIKRAREGTVDVNYGAPALVLTANKKDYVNAMADCACALENMMLAACEAGIGSCWINQYKHLGAAPPLAAFMKEVGLAEDEAIYGALALGYAEHLETEPLPRKGNPVTYVP